MNQEKISSHQLCSILICFLFGSVFAINSIMTSGQDTWLAFLIGWGGGFVLLAVTLAIYMLHPNKTLVGILVECFGKAAGKALSLVYTAYFFLLTALVANDFSFYSTTTNYPETPAAFFLICVVAAAAFCLFCGIETLGRVSEIFAVVSIFNVLISVALLFSLFRFGYFKPFLSRGIKPVLKSGFNTAMLPFSEIFLCLTIFPRLNDQKKVSRSSSLAFFLVGLVFLIEICRDILVLGPGLATRELYPMFVVYKLAPIPFSVEALLDINVALSVIVKVSLCVYGASTGIAEIFGIKNGKVLIIPVAAVSAAISFWMSQNGIENITIAERIIPLVYLFLFVAFPLILLVVSLVRTAGAENRGG